MRLANDNKIVKILFTNAEKNDIINTERVKGRLIIWKAPRNS
jgi:hypothetical protein